MASSTRASGDNAQDTPATGSRRAGWRKVPLFVWASAAFVVVVVLAAIFAPLVAPYDPVQQSLRDRLKSPTWFPEAGQRRHLLGTDQLGRDTLSRIIYGSRISLAVGFAAVVIGGAIGGSLGLLSGYAGGIVDEIVMLVVDAQLAFPFILLAIGIIAVLGPSFGNLIIIVGLSGWVTYARLIRAQVLTIKEREYVLAIRGLGGSTFRILANHIVPNTMAPFLVIITLELSGSAVAPKAKSALTEA